MCNAHTIDSTGCRCQARTAYFQYDGLSRSLLILSFQALADMGCAGSNHDFPVTRCHNGEQADSHFGTLSIQRVHDSNCTYHVVECKFAGTTIALQQKFVSTGPEDPEGRVAAFVFALSTGSLPAFRAFLFAHPESLNPGSTCLTHQNRFTVFVSPRKNASLGLRFNAAVCRFLDGSLRSISFRSSNEQAGFEQATMFFHSSKFRSWLVRAGMKGAMLVASEVENCKSDGTASMRCKYCGELEPSEYSNQRSQQASEDYLCSACLIMERKVIFVISLEEQVEIGPESWDTFCSRAGSVYVENNFEACSICGCEDNEDLEDLVPCLCQFSEAVVHTSCSTACKPLASLKNAVLSSTAGCLICGKSEVGMPNSELVADGIPSRGLKRSITSSQGEGGEVKRPRISSSDVVTQVKNMPEVNSPLHNVSTKNAVQTQTQSGDPECPKIESARHSWRSADSPAVVPFKKRRIQIAEFPRSPSPPPKSLISKDAPPSPKQPMLELCHSKSGSRSPSSKPDSLCSTDFRPLLLSSASLPSPSSLTPVPPLCTLNTASPVSKLPPMDVASPLPGSCSLEPVPELLSPNPLCSPSPKSFSPKHPSATSDMSPVCIAKFATGRMFEEIESPPKFPGEERRPQVFSPHCDRGVLNIIGETNMSADMHCSPIAANQNQLSNSQEVEDGELVISTEKISDDFEVPGELPEVSSKVARGPGSQGLRYNPGAFRDDRSGWDLNTDMDTWDRLSDKAFHASTKMGKSSRTVSTVMGQKSDVSVHLMRAKQSMQVSGSELVKESTDGCTTAWCREADTATRVPVTGKGPAAFQSEGFGRLGANVPGVEIPASKVSEEACERQEIWRHKFAVKVERQTNHHITRAGVGVELAEEPEGEEHVDYGDFDCQESRDTELEMNNRSPILQGDAYWKGGDASVNPPSWERTSSLDGGEREATQDDLKKCSTSGRVKSSGWDQLPEGFESVEEAMKAAQEVLSRRGRGSRVSFSSRAPGSFSSHHHFNSREDDTRDGPECFRDRHLDNTSHSRDSFHRSKGSGGSSDNYNSSRGRSSGRTMAGTHSRGHYKEWVEDRQGGSINRWGHERRHLTSGFSSQGATNAAGRGNARTESSGFVVGSDGSDSRGRTLSMRSMFVNSCRVRGPHSSGRAPSVDMDRGSKYSDRSNSRSDRVMTRSSRIDSGEREVRAREGMGIHGRLSDRDAFTGHGFGDKYRRLSHSSQIVEPRRSQSPRRMHLPDHPHTSSRHSPGSRSESRIRRSRFSSPSPDNLQCSKFYPSSARSQHSPPSHHKWSHDGREAEGFRERDFRRPPPRYGTSGRTSPHVVHGSSLMDERDLQVLAGTRNSPCARGRLSCSRDGSPGLHRSRRAEEEGRRGSISKDSGNSNDSPREFDKYREMRGIVQKRDRSREDDKRREAYRSLKSTGGHR